MQNRTVFVGLVALASVACAASIGCGATGGGDATGDDGGADSTVGDSFAPDAPKLDSAKGDSTTTDTKPIDSGVDTNVGADTTPPPDTAPPPTSLDLHDCTLFDNAPDLADWPVTTTITEVEFQPGGADGVHVTFDKSDGAGRWPDITPPGWTGPLQYTLGFCEYIGGKWYGSAAIQFWYGLHQSGGNVAQDTVSKAQCSTFGYGSTCQVAKNWYYDGRWGALNGYQPATGEYIGVFVAAGNLRGVKDGSQSPVHERSNVVLVPFPNVAGGKHTF